MKKITRRNSRWLGTSHRSMQTKERYSNDRKVEATYQVRGRNGKWRRESENMGEIEYCNTFAHNPLGFFRGASNKYMQGASSPSRIEQIVFNIRIMNEHQHRLQHHHELRGVLLAA